MERIYTILVTKDEQDSIEKELVIYGDKIKDYDLSKVFNVQGIEVMYYALVTDDETFDKITQNVNGNRIY